MYHSGEIRYKHVPLSICTSGYHPSDSFAPFFPESVLTVRSYFSTNAGNTHRITIISRPAWGSNRPLVTLTTKHSHNTLLLILVTHSCNMVKKCGSKSDMFLISLDSLLLEVIHFEFFSIKVKARAKKERSIMKGSSNNCCLLTNVFVVLK